MFKTHWIREITFYEKNVCVTWEEGYKWHIDLVIQHVNKMVQILTPMVMMNLVIFPMVVEFQCHGTSFYFIFANKDKYIGKNVKNWIWYYFTIK